MAARSRSPLSGGDAPGCLSETRRRACDIVKALHRAGNRDNLDIAYNRQMSLSEHSDGLSGAFQHRPPDVTVRLDLAPAASDEV